MKSLVALSIVLLLLAPAAAGAQQPLVRVPSPLGPAIRTAPARHAVPPGEALRDSTRSSFNANIFRGAAVGGIIGGIIGAVASEHQAVGVGFTHTPAVLFVATYGGLGVLLGLIAGTMLPGS
ncbi:MAG: hypothetical protein M3Z17_06365 [Gemmatimonadota bacterium]|nr:hypothetical protein [Gemmatimonadota bacterium]